MGYSLLGTPRRLYYDAASSLMTRVTSVSERDLVNMATAYISMSAKFVGVEAVAVAPTTNGSDEESAGHGVEMPVPVTFVVSIQEVVRPNTPSKRPMNDVLEDADSVFSAEAVVGVAPPEEATVSVWFATPVMRIAQPAVEVLAGL